MKKLFPAVLSVLLLLSSCGSPSAEVTPKPEPTPTEEVTPTPTPVPTETPIPGALTEEEIRWFEEVFFQPDRTNIRNVFAHPPAFTTYDCPQNINLAQIFCAADLDEASDDEVSELIRRGAFPEMFNELLGGSGEYICPVYRMTRGEMSHILQKYTGLSLEETNQVGLDHLPYLEEYDAYYWCFGDESYPGPVTILSGIRVGSFIYLYQNHEYWTYCLYLEQQPEGNYWFVANAPMAGE